MGQVFINACESYDYQKIRQEIIKILDQSQLSQKVFPGAKILIKANLLMKKTPEESVTTHPYVVQATSEYFVAKGCQVVIGDSPAGPFTPAALKGIYQASGMDKAAQLSGGELNYNVGFSRVEFPEAVKLKYFDVIDVVQEADFVISAAKLKTHGMMTMTGAVKNLFGVIPGLTKAEYHFKLTAKENFALHLLDIAQFIKPDFSLIDAIDCMEGNGPSNGIKKHVGLLIGGDNPHETDYVAMEVAGIPLLSVPTLTLARDLGYLNPGEIKISGVDYTGMRLSPFVLPESADIVFGLDRLPGFLRDFILKRIKSKPDFVHSKCISCGHCIRNCPAKIIHMNENNKPVANLENCISCFCCHEVCPEDAIRIQQPLLLKIIKKI